MLQALLLFSDPFNKQTYLKSLKKKSPATKKSTDFIQKYFSNFLDHMDISPVPPAPPPSLLGFLENTSHEYS